MEFTNQELITKVKSGDFRAISRLISLIENSSSRVKEIESELFKNTGNALVIGITGSPGAGKSTLVDRLAQEYKKKSKKVAVLAVDPTSPFSGGAVLGDRIRMIKTAENDDIYIRSMATRGSLGGISKAVLSAIHVLDAAGFDLILIETVGVGQAEVDIVKFVDTCLVVLVPGMGDSVQALKAGILEIADLYIINKADYQGVDLLQKELTSLLSLANYEQDMWEPPILKTIANKGDGIDEILTQVHNHKQWLDKTSLGKENKLLMLEAYILMLAKDILSERIISKSSKDIKKMAEKCLARKLDPRSCAEEVVKLI